jgi:endonuclease-3
MDGARVSKKPFDIRVAFRKLRAAVKPLPKAAMFQLAEEGFHTLFEQLVACLISIRTRDETTVPVAHALFAKARTPEQMVKLTPQAIDRLISASTFHLAKAFEIHQIAKRAIEDFAGELPPDFEKLTSLRGVGPKCANLVLGIVAGQAAIAVDIHVHRVTNRWGYVRANTPEKTMEELQARLPKRYWIELNSLLVPFGKHICTGVAPRCSKCPLLDMCQQVGVGKHR